MSVSILNMSNINDISKILLDGNRLKLLSYLEYKNFNWTAFRFFCYQYARYGVPTVELIAFLKQVIGNRTAIEIGAGSGDLGHYLGIPMTDSKVQEDPLMKARYDDFSQPTIKYPNEVERIEALETVKKYKPQVVVASWVTTFSPIKTSYGSSPYGVREDEILKLVDTYILIGSLECHGDKPIMKIPHRVIDEPFIISRNSNKNSNRIFIWDND